MKKRSKPTRTVYGPKSPVRPYRQVMVKSGDPGYVNRILVATPTTGNIRMEWAMSRYGQIIPTNWSQVQMVQYMHSFVPLDYLVADAQNIVIKEAIEKDFEWLLFVEHDVLISPDFMVKINQYIRNETVPVVSGLYFTKSNPSEPLIYRGRGVSFYQDFKLGEKVWVDGVPTGALLIHMALIREMWKDSQPYNAGGTVTRRLFETPRNMYFDPETQQFNSTQGTSDLDWCTRVIEGNYLEKAGWKKIGKKKFPFLMDTTMFCRHIDENGVQYPMESELKVFQKNNARPRNPRKRRNKSR